MRGGECKMGLKPVYEYQVIDSHIMNAIKAAKDQSRLTGGPVYFTFNNVAICAHYMCTDKDLLDCYTEAIDGLRSARIRRANLAGCEYWPDTYERKRSSWEDLV